MLSEIKVLADKPLVDEEALVPEGKVSRERLAELNRPALGRWLLALAFDWGLIAATMVAVHLLHHHPLAWAAALIVIGTRQHAISILGHEAVHRSVSRKRWLNDTLAQVACFWPMAS